MNNLNNAPEPLKSFLIYIESIQGKSLNTANEYFYDLRTFYRFLVMHFNSIDEGVEFESIDISGVDIDLLKKVDLDVVYEYVNFLNRDKNNSNITRARKISALRSYFKYLCNKKKLLDENPTADLDSIKIPKRLPHYFTLENSLKLLEAVQDSRNPERDYCILTLFLNCGLRLSELVSIDLTDIQDNTLVVTGKGDKERTIYLNEACIDAIKQYIPVRNRQNPSAFNKNALFLSERNNRISTRSVQRVVENTVKKIGLDPHKYTTHKLRHTAATLMHQSGVDIRDLQEILGHKQLSTTEIYTHVDSERLRQAVDKNPLANVKIHSEDNED